MDYPVPDLSGWRRPPDRLPPNLIGLGPEDEEPMQWAERVFQRILGLLPDWLPDLTNPQIAWLQSIPANPEGFILLIRCMVKYAYDKYRTARTIHRLTNHPKGLGVKFEPQELYEARLEAEGAMKIASMFAQLLDVMATHNRPSLPGHVWKFRRLLNEALLFR